MRLNEDVSSHREETKLILIHQQPVMECALDILTELIKHKVVVLKARGNSIPIAVSVANVITENMLKDNSRILDISVDSDVGVNDGPMISTIEITLSKTN